MLPLKKILCPTDFSEPSYKALEVGNEFALHFGAQLFLVHVVTPPTTVVMAETMAAERISNLADEMESWARRNIEDAQAKRIPLAVRSRAIVVRGDPPGQIVKLADAEEVDLVIIATHGHTGFRRFVSGSVAERVARMSSKPVLVVQMPVVVGN